jgi:tetratricopeptide (TPR) repeat protein
MQTIKNSASNALSLLTAVMLCTACRPAGVRSVIEGQKLLEQGNYSLAVEKLRIATGALGNTNAQAFNYLGLACHQAGQAAEAEKAYRRALAVNPDLTEAHYNLGCLLLSENKLDPAKAELMAYTLRCGNSAEGWIKLGTVQLRVSGSGNAATRSSELSAAEKSFEEGLRLNPKDPEGLNGLGLVRLRRNHPAEAANLFSRALKEKPDYGPAMLNLAIVAQQNLNQPQVALQKYREYLRLKPQSSDVDAISQIINQLEAQLAPEPRPLTSHNPPGQIRTDVATNTSAQVELTRAIIQPRPPLANSTEVVSSPKQPSDAGVLKSTVPTNPPPTASDKAEETASANFELVKLPAEPVFKPAEDVVPKPPPVSELTADSAPAPASTLPTGKPPKTPKRTFLQRINPLNLFAGEGKSTSLTPLASASAMENVANPGEDTAQQSGRYPYAMPERPVSGNRSEAERVFSQAVRAQQSQRYAEAINAYQQAAQLDPSFYDVQYNLGLAATEAGNLPMALRAYETALAIQPESLDARYNFALALKQSNYPIDSANELGKLLENSPNEGRANLALGNLYAQQFRDISKARAHYLKVLESDPHNPQADAIRYWLKAHPGIPGQISKDPQ